MVCERHESMYDSLTILKKSIEKINPIQLKKPPSCSDVGLDWPTGKKIYEYKRIISVLSLEIYLLFIGLNLK